MKVLLDEELPHRLRMYLGAHEVHTVDYMGWAGLKNGELLRAAIIIGPSAYAMVRRNHPRRIQRNDASRRICANSLKNRSRSLETPTIGEGRLTD